MLSQFALLLGVAARRPATQPRATSPPPSAPPVRSAPTAASATVRRSPREIAMATAQYLRDEIDDDVPLLEEDVVETAQYVCDRDGVERIGVVPLMAEFARLPGVRKARRRVSADHDLRHIRQRLQCRGAAHMRATIIWVAAEPAAEAKPTKDHWKVPSGVSGHVSGKRVQPRQRGLDLMIGYEVPRRRAA